MTDTLKLKNGLIMPSNFIEVKDDEMEYLDGCGFWNIFGVICTIIAGTGAIVCGVVALLAPEPTGLTKSGGVVGIISGVATIGAGVACFFA